MDGRIPNTLRGLIFDVGDVLYDGSLWRRWLLQLLARMNVRKSYAQFYREWEQQYYPQACLGYGDYWQVLRDYLADQGLCEGQVDEICRAASTREKQGENHPRAFRGVARTLGLLHASGYQLAALSNTEFEETQLRRKLGQIGLDIHFDAIISSRNSGVLKPHAEAYRAAMSSWPFAPHEVAFVGHDADELQGANDCGLMTIALFHEPQVQADWRIDDFADLSHLLGTPQLRAA